MRKAARVLAASIFWAAGAYVLGSWVVGRRLARRLTSAEGLLPPREERENLLAALREKGAVVQNLWHRGSRHHPVGLAAVFASPDAGAARRPTILFLHGKGGNSSEWRPEALRALDCGYNVLLPDLRGHGESGGTFVTYGFLETEDLANAIAAARDRAGLAGTRIGIHGCSAGATLAIQLAATREDVAALWLESPFADPAEMARHYLSLSTGIPSRYLRLTSRFALHTAVARVRRILAVEGGADGFRAIDPADAIARVRAPICLVYGEKDELVPPRFAARLEASLSAGSSVWRAADAGHCHHDDEPARVDPEEYDRKWRAFFSRHLPVE